MEYKSDKGGPATRNYFEGILQLRNPTKEAVRAVRSMVERNKRAFIAKEERVVNGIDLYLSSQKFLQILGKMLQNKFGGELKISRKLFTVHRITSKRVYRVTVLFRLPKFKVGDIVKTRGRLIKVKSLGKKVFGIDIETGKKITVDYKHVQA